MTETTKELRAEIRRLNKLLKLTGKVNRTICKALLEMRKCPKKQ